MTGRIDCEILGFLTQKLFSCVFKVYWLINPVIIFCYVLISADIITIKWENFIRKSETLTAWLHPEFEPGSLNYSPVVGLTVLLSVFLVFLDASFDFVWYVSLSVNSTPI